MIKNQQKAEKIYTIYKKKFKNSEVRPLEKIKLFRSSRLCNDGSIKNIRDFLFVGSFW